MKQIPFYANGQKPLVAIYQTLFDYFMHKQPSSEEVEQFMAGDPLAALHRQGIDIDEVASSLEALDTQLGQNQLVLIDVPQEPLLIIQHDGQAYLAHNPAQGTAYERLTPEQLVTKLAGTAVIYGFSHDHAHRSSRLDQYVVAQRPRLSRSYAAKLIDQGRVLVDGQPAKAGYKVRPGNLVTIDFDEGQLDLPPEIDLPILYEDADCIVINKPAGVLTHAQAKFIHEATVATFLRSRIKANDLTGERAGIVHRLDRATSGVIICAKNQRALSWFQGQFASRTVQKTYVAVVAGQVTPEAAVIDMPIERNPKAPATFRVGKNGKPAMTQYKVLQESEKYSLLELTPKTGRTHQLRVHLQKLGHPIVGDPLYGTGTYGDRLYLHAKKLRLTLLNGEDKTFQAPLPPEFKDIMKT